MAEALVKAFKKVRLVNGKRVNGSRQIAALVVEAVTTGKVVFTLDDGDTRTMVLGTHEWSELVKWAYTYLEPPVTKQELAGADGGDLVVKILRGASMDEL